MAQNAENDENEANFDVELEELSDSDLDEEALDAIADGSTKNATKWGVKIFQSWAERRNINVDFHTINDEHLNSILRKFYGEVN